MESVPLDFKLPTEYTVLATMQIVGEYTESGELKITYTVSD